MISFVASRDGAALDRLAEAVGTSIDPAVRGSLLRFAELVSTWGRKTDLVKASSAAQLVEVLFLDAFVVARFLHCGRLIDVGAGAGAPTLPLLLLRPDLQATLLEPRRRRVAFLRTAVGALGLRARAQVREGRLESSPDAALRGFDVALSRATFAPDDWLERGARLAERVVVLLARGEPPSVPGWIPKRDERYVVPSSRAPRRALCYHPG